MRRERAGSYSDGPILASWEAAPLTRYELELRDRLDDAVAGVRARMPFADPDEPTDAELEARLAAIAAELDVDVEEVSTRSGHGVDVLTGREWVMRRRWDRELRAAVADGLTVDEIVERLRADHDAVRHGLRKRGLKAAPKPRHTWRKVNPARPSDGDVCDRCGATRYRQVGSGWFHYYKRGDRGYRTRTPPCVSPT